MSNAQDPPPETPRPRKGRGALSNPRPRFAEHDRAAVDDGWHGDLGSPGGALPPGGLPHPGGADLEMPALRTRLHLDSARSILSRNDSPDVPFDRSSTPTAAANTAVSIVMRARATPTSGSRRGSISRRKSSTSLRRRRCCGRNWRGPATAPRPSPWAPTPMPTSRASGIWRSPGACSGSCTRPATRWW